MRRKIIEVLMKLGKARWIVDDEGDVGFEVFGIGVINYKWNDSFIYLKKGCGLKWRLADKRELCSRKHEGWSDGKQES